jgi:hypothetical protein
LLTTQWLSHSDARQASDLPTPGKFNLTVFDRGGSKTLGKKEFADGKSQTCRASEWLSHCSGHIKLRQEARAVSKYVITLPAEELSGKA